jgi:hypothetical protein
MNEKGNYPMMFSIIEYSYTIVMVVVCLGMPVLCHLCA